MTGGCNIDACNRPHYARGLCQPPYMQAWHGNPPTRPTTRPPLPESWKVPRP